jgi:hypothetical protein
MKVQIIITGDYCENYGAHTWDGTGSCPQYWKNKGQHNEVVACNVDLVHVPEVIAEIRERLESYSWSDEGSSCGFYDVRVSPNRMTMYDQSAMDYKFYEDVEKYPREALMEFLNAFGLLPAEEPAQVDRFESLEVLEVF